MADALRAQLGAAATARLFHAAGLDAYLTAPPAHMVFEQEVAALHRAARATLGTEQARAIAREAGLRTGDYLLKHRIPRGAQRVLRLLPAAFASRTLLAAIARNAWTFAGNGRFEIRPGRPLRLSIAGCPICAHAESEVPLCDYYAAAFERLFHAMVSRSTRVTETACQAMGAPACTFEARW